MKTLVLNLALVLFLFSIVGTVLAKEEESPWKPAPPGMPEGVKIAVVEGNPDKTGTFIIQVKFPKKMEMGMHTHVRREQVVVVKGRIYLGFGDKFKTSKARSIRTGEYFVNAPGASHFVYTKDEECIVQITGEGPWEISFGDETEEKEPAEHPEKPEPPKKKSTYRVR